MPARADRRCGCKCYFNRQIFKILVKETLFPILGTGTVPCIYFLY
uniref:Uncharacterized protein n=1 Tax=Anguilla anguilla TaxID=7936 RepID=A0A0E9P6E3_ANGAN